jgi:6-bladed beta-propeller
VAVCLCAAATACGPPESDAASGAVSVTVDTVAGVEYVRSAGEAPRWTFEPMLELGSAGNSDEPRADEFAFVSSVALGPDGLLYVADMQNYRIVVFDTAGAVRDTIGRRGKGPGEFEDVFSIAWTGDTLLAFDPTNGRVNLFAPAGAWIGSWPAAGRRLVETPVLLRLYQVGAREVYRWVYRPGRPGGEWADAAWRRYVDGGEPDEWLQFRPAPPRPFPDKVVCTLARGFSWFDHPYAPRALEHPAPGNRAWVATSDAYLIALRDSAGDTVRVVERMLDPPMLSDAEWGATAARFAAWMETKDPGRCEPRSLARPERKPAVEGIMVDVTGRLWVERNLERGTRWEVFDLGGRLVGAVDGFGHDRQRTVPWLGARHVAWVGRDTLDVPRVHLARLRPVK